jgi:hypothetical protein
VAVADIAESPAATVKGLRTLRRRSRAYAPCGSVPAETHSPTSAMTLGVGCAGPALRDTSAISDEILTPF